MPNHVTTICTVTGPESAVDTFASAHFPLSEKSTKTAEVSGPYFDFGTIIPRPKILDGIVKDGNLDLGVAAVVGGLVWTDFTRFGVCNTGPLVGAPFGHARQVRSWLEKNKPEVLEAGRKACAAIGETGYPDWCEWSIAKWGTKWGAYGYEPRTRGPGKLVFKFETAWSFPEPIFRKLAEMYPALTFAIASYDEGSNFACTGEFNGKNDYACGDATDELYALVYGRPAPKYDDDGEEIESAVSP